MPRDCNELPADVHGVPECGDDLPDSGYGLPANDDAVHECGYAVPGGGDAVSSGSHAMPADCDGLCATGPGANLHHHDVSLIRNKRSHRGRAGVPGG
jgi:hypothetical protein